MLASAEAGLRGTWHLKRSRCYRWRHTYQLMAVSHRYYFLEVVPHPHQKKSIPTDTAWQRVRAGRGGAGPGPAERAADISTVSLSCACRGGGAGCAVRGRPVPGQGRGAHEGGGMQVGQLLVGSCCRWCTYDWSDINCFCWRVVPPRHDLQQQCISPILPRLVLMQAHVKLASGARVVRGLGH